MLALLVAVSFGFDYGITNQPTYLLDGLRRVDPAVLAHDWLASQTYAYHPAFGWVVWLAAQIGPLPWTLTILNTLLVAAALFGLSWLVRQVTDDDIWLTSLLVLCLVAIDQTVSIAGSYVFGDSLQPSSLAGIAFLAAIGCFLGGRWLSSGIALAVAGIFHVNYLVLGIGAFAFAQLLLGPQSLVRRGTLQLVPSLVVLVANLPVLLDVASAPSAAEGARIFMEIRAPHHYLPRRYLDQLTPFLAWQLAALALWPLASLTEPSRRTLRALWAALALSVIAATAINVVTFVPQISQLFVWRLAPYAVLLAQLVACTACVRLVHRSARGRNGRDGRDGTLWLRGAIAVAAVGVVIAYRIAHKGEPLGGNLVSSLALAGLLVAVTAAVLAASRLPSRVVRWGLAAAALVGIAAPVRSGWRYVAQSSTLVRGEGILREAGLYRWARSTPADTRFLIPPGLGEFRLRTLRAIVVDWKSTPVRPEELVEWYRRIEAVAGRRVGSRSDAVRGYATMDSARLVALCERYALDYAVVRRRNMAAARLARAFPVVYADSAYVVLDLARASPRTGIVAHRAPVRSGVRVESGGPLAGPETFMEPPKRGRRAAPPRARDGHHTS